MPPEPANERLLPVANERYFEPVEDEPVEDDDIEFAPGLPPLDEKSEQPTPKRDGGSQATTLVHLAEDAGAEFFHDQDGEPFARIPVGDHWETWPQRRKGFKSWLRRLYYEENEGAPNSQAMQDALGVLAGKAQFGGDQHPVATRVAGFEAAIYHDLANEAWEAVEVTADRWRVVQNPPVRFRRTRGQAPLPHPVPGGSLDELRPFLNCPSDDDFHLFVGCLVQALRPRGPFIGYAAHGEQGSAKSTRSRVFRALIDPNSAPLRSAPRDERDLMIAATNAWVVTIDNLSWLPGWFSDALCRLATGGGLSTRELYTDSDEMIFDAQRPVLLNGIEEVATRGDLLDRLILAQLPRIPDDQRRPEDEFWADFEEARPRLYGALLDATSWALRNVADVKLDRHPRMADATRWVTAAEPALGWAPHTFLEAYLRNRRDADDVALEASPLAQLVRDVAADGFVGTATELLRRLEDAAGEKLPNQKSWPKSGSSLSGKLHRLAPTLRASGVAIDFEREPGGPGGRGSRRRLVLLRAAAQEDVPSGPSVPSPAPGKKSEGTSEGTHSDEGTLGADGAARTPVPSASPFPERPLVPAEPGRDGRDAPPQLRSHDARDGHVPLLGDGDFLDFVLTRSREEHLTTGEALDLERLHTAVANSRAISTTTE